jgi:hypothetical protein
MQRHTSSYIIIGDLIDIFSKFIKILSSVLVLIIATTFYSMSELN